MFIDLKTYGWDSELETEFQNILIEKPRLIPGRIISVHRTQYEIMTKKGMMISEITGNRLKNKDIYSKPVVGDWVVLSLGEAGNANIIKEILKRKTLLERRRAHSDVDVQIIASNIDTAVIVQSLAQDFSIKRLERVLIQLTNTGISPLIILNKIDLVKDITSVYSKMKSLDQNIPVIYSSFKTNKGLSDIHNFLKPNESVVFIGSSGVGKSSIINTMLDKKYEQKTSEVSDYSGKGKHTTTVRRLFLLDNGVIVIDTPGTREFGVTVDDEVLNNSFSKIEEIARGCKFRNCGHGYEPECKVREAILQGHIDEDTFRHYQKLESQYLHKKTMKIHRF